MTDWGDLMEQWGTPAFLKERYEQQMWLQSSWLGRTLGPLLIRAVAVTGSDPYVREGSDVTVLFHVHDANAAASVRRRRDGA